MVSHSSLLIRPEQGEFSTKNDKLRPLAVAIVVLWWWCVRKKKRAAAAAAAGSPRLSDSEKGEVDPKLSNSSGSESKALGWPGTAGPRLECSYAASLPQTKLTRSLEEDSCACCYVN